MEFEFFKIVFFGYVRKDEEFYEMFIEIFFEFRGVIDGFCEGDWIKFVLWFYESDIFVRWRVFKVIFMVI